MNAQNSHFLSLAISDGGSPASFTKVSGIQQLQFEIIQRPAAHHGPAEADSWQRMHAETGTAQLRITARGRFENSTAEAAIRSHALANTAQGYQLSISQTETLTARLLITRYQRSSAIDSPAIEYRLEAVSAGEVVYGA